MKYITAACLLVATIPGSSAGGGKLRGTGKGPTYDMFGHSAIQGNKIGERVYTSNIADCTKACEAHVDCVGFVEVFGDKPYCVLKSSSETLHDMLDKRVHLKPTHDGDKHEMEGTYEVYTNSAIAGDKIGERVYYTRESGVSACVTACDELEDCVAIVDVFDEEKPFCVLKSATKGLYRRMAKRVLMKPETTGSNRQLAEVEKERLKGYEALAHRAIDGRELGERILYGSSEHGIGVCAKACDALDDCDGFVDAYSAEPEAYCVLKSDSRRTYRTAPSAGVRVLVRVGHDGAEAHRVRALREETGGRKLESDDDDYSAYSGEAKEYEYLLLQGLAVPRYSITMNGGTRQYYDGGSDASRAHCKGLCDAESSCIGFVDNYAPSSPYCVLKTSSSSGTIALSGRDSKNFYMKKSDEGNAALNVQWETD